MKLSTLYKLSLNEATLDLIQDVEYVYKNGGFAKFISDFNNKKYPLKSEIFYDSFTKKACQNNTIKSA